MSELIIFSSTIMCSMCYYNKVEFLQNHFHNRNQIFRACNNGGSTILAKIFETNLHKIQSCKHFKRFMSSFTNASWDQIKIFEDVQLFKNVIVNSKSTLFCSSWLKTSYYLYGEKLLHVKLQSLIVFHRCNIHGQTVLWFLNTNNH